ncbi:uncharacterized protein FYW23_006052 [Sylvia borin]
MMLNMLTCVLYLSLYIFPNMGYYLPALILLRRPGYGTKIALLFYYVRCLINSEAMNIIQNIYPVLCSCSSLGCYVWGLNNLTQPLWGGVKNDFFQLFRNDTAVFEYVEYPLDAKDSMMFLLFLLCFLCMARIMLRIKTLHKEVEEVKRSKATASTSTQTVTEEKGTKGVAAVSSSTQTITEEKEAKGELRDLRREFTRQTNESILTWLLRIWDAAANDTILDGTEARQLGSLSRDVVIDQGIGKNQETLSLWQRLLASVKDRYLCKEDLLVHQGKWSTIEQGIRCLRELAVLEIIFSEDERFPKSPDDVQCTSRMWLRFARLGPEIGKPIWAADIWQDIAARVERLTVKVRHVDAHVPKSRATEEHRNNEQVSFFVLIDGNDFCKRNKLYFHGSQGVRQIAKDDDEIWTKLTTHSRF